MAWSYKLHLLPTKARILKLTKLNAISAPLQSSYNPIYRLLIFSSWAGISSDSFASWFFSLFANQTIFVGARTPTPKRSTEHAPRSQLLVHVFMNENAEDKKRNWVKVFCIAPPSYDDALSENVLALKSRLHQRPSFSLWSRCVFVSGKKWGHVWSELKYSWVVLLTS